MSSTQSWGEYLTGGGGQKGARRQKLAGYLQTANEMRQSYTKSITHGRSSQPEEWIMTGDEQLILFPSYAKWKTPRKRMPTETAAATTAPTARADEGFEPQDDGQDGIIEVDVRGWLFKPQSGQLSRKNRIVMEVARRMCGLDPLPASTEVPGEASLSEEEIVNEAQKLTSDTTSSGRNSPARNDSGANTPVRTSSGTSTPVQQQPYWSVTSKPVIRKASAAISAWRNPYATSNASQTPTPQLIEEHAELLARLTPFMHQPLPNQPLSVFIYNAETSTSRRVETDERGHFSLRATVDFVPTDIRVFVSDKLSISEPIKLLEKNGVSLISDIDDTIKHSAVHAGTREMFRNTFIKPLDGLIIEGVKEWYNTLANSPYNVQIHYVSNSPWQLYPLLESYMKMAGMPPGSFHLKQYSGMLKGIFEPVAERKKSSLERLIRDFPDRKWILVGDAGEMDLEVYSEIALTFPGRVKGIFIRDVLSDTLHGKVQMTMQEMDAANRTFFSQSVSTPSAQGQSSNEPPLPPRRSFTSSNLEVDGRKPPPPPPKPRDLQAAQLSTKSRSNSGASANSNWNQYGPLDQQYPPPPPPPRTNTATSISSLDSQMPGKMPENMTAAERKLEVWHRRWAYAKQALEQQGVFLRTWKVGTDAMDDCLRIVKRELREGRKEGL